MTSLAPTPAKAGIRHAHLDALRGLATLLVIWMHATEAFIGRSAPAPVEAWLFDLAATLHFGRIGVVIFFALSGYLIAASIDTPDWKWAFPLKRALRLYPAYLFSIVCLCLVSRAIPDAATLGANLTMLPTLFGKNELMGIYWTLQTEVIFYAVFYLLFAAGAARGARGLLGISVAFTLMFVATELFVPGATLDALPLFIKKLPHHLGLMFAGAYFHKVSREPAPRAQNLLLLAAVGIPPLVILLDLLIRAPSKGFPVIGAYPIAIAITLGFFILKPRSAPLAALGKISYSAYLNHALLLLLYAPYAGHHGMTADLLFLFGATWLMSTLTYRLIELPMIRLSHRPESRMVFRPRI